MGWKFWKSKPVVPPEKEFLLHCREVMLEASYRMALFDRICQEYFKDGESSAVKRMLWQEWIKMAEPTNLWDSITEIEDTLRNKYGVETLDAAHLESLRFDLLESNIRKAAFRDERDLRIVRPAGNEADRASSNAQSQTQ